MSGDIKPEQLLFLGQKLVLRPLLGGGDSVEYSGGPVFERAEQGTLALLPIGVHAGRPRECAIDLPEQRGAILAETVTSATFDERFEHFPVEGAAVHVLAHFVERVERADVLARF